VAVDGLTVFLCGDVMTGRGIDQILAHPGDPALHEPVVDDARTYVALAEQANGPIAKPVDPGWPWGDAIAVLDDVAPQIRLLNLETAITPNSAFAPGKAVHYRMHPDNVACLTAIRPDVCVLANNHVLDFGQAGLTDTLSTLGRAGIAHAGAGETVEQAERPVAVDVPGGRVITVAAGMKSSGIPGGWAATADSPGIALVPDLSKRSATGLAERVLSGKRPGDVTVVSLHWGGNWGYRPESGQRRFAHRLIDAGVDVVYGHSSHHPRPIEVYRGKLILYSCGDIVNDYEGIRSHTEYRDELRLLYFATIDHDDGELMAVRMAPMRARRMRLERASRADAAWLRSTLDHASRRFGTRVDADADGMLCVRPSRSQKRVLQ
jgi:poly-gamma-glutamate synthesis protein (capsule biosynthesis protein)